MEPTRYRISNSPAVTEQFRAILSEEERGGQLAEVLAAARRLFHRLALIPLDSGESRGELAHLNLALRIAFDNPLAVSYGVHEESRSVFIREIRVVRPRRPGSA